MQTGVIEKVRGERLIYLASVEHFITAALFLSHASALSQLQAMPSMLWVVTSAEDSGSNITKLQTMHRLKNGRLCSKEHTKLISPLHLNKPKGQIACHSLGSSGPFGELQTRSTIFLELAAEPETGL